MFFALDPSWESSSSSSVLLSQSQAGGIQLSADENCSSRKVKIAHLDFLKCSCCWLTNYNTFKNFSVDQHSMSEWWSSRNYCFSLPSGYNVSKRGKYCVEFWKWHSGVVKWLQKPFHTPRKFQVQSSLQQNTVLGMTVSWIPKYKCIKYSNSLWFRSVAQAYWTLWKPSAVNQGTLTWNKCCSSPQRRHRDTPRSRSYYLDTPLWEKKDTWKQTWLTFYTVFPQFLRVLMKHGERGMGNDLQRRVHGRHPEATRGPPYSKF